ncbi:molybdopterin-dependent oxidoreductase [Desulfovibrio sulfodismutans]|uniref:Molybdopterin-dependent oxidoreductase n=1 Tax=Desulfolutivibrio sulfodismutans TaxID=63561 RepID=A0A7K3NQH9_9BACT|nr:menaquinone reductase molybdopterin-binding-like subunit QrcB [Desulfolutivibrio sulfodismutans]NDY58043.1 molybdopterin-dependent oxidoreductase [Desulfolutivibrio sulfodismutans]QLA11848.1 molybdopterin-dependent oxidoreductase [Desulfolutivibrio sulfodismutans DSM 3696]
MGLDRRAFIGLVAGGAVGTLFTPIPWKLADDAAIWTQNWPWIPRVPRGEVTFATTASKLCPSGTGLKVTLAGGKPITASGNPEHPLSQGSVSPIGASEVYMLYSPARVRTPMRKSGGKFEPITWEQAQTELMAKCKAAGNKVACISGDVGGTVGEALSAFLAKVGSAAMYAMPGEAGPAAAGFKLMGGQGRVGFDIDNADCVLILGSDIFEGSGVSVRNRKAFCASHPLGKDQTAKYAYAGPVRNHTGSVSDAWIPVASAHLGTLALGIAWHLLKAGATTDAADMADFKKLVEANYSPDKVSKLIGVGPEVLAGIAKNLAAAKAPLVIPGSEMGQGMGPGAFIAGMSLNMLLGRMNKPGGVMALPELPAVFPGAETPSEILARDLPGYLKGVGEGKAAAPEVLFVYAANPAYGLPQSGAMAAALEKIPFKVSFASFMDETAAMCDLILPNSLTLERFDDVATPYGSAFCSMTLVKPLVAPIFDTKTTADFILDTAKKMNLALGHDSLEKALKEKAAVLAKSDGFVAKETMPWEVLAGKDKPAFDPAGLWKSLEAGLAWVKVGQVAQTGLSFASKVLAALKPTQAELSLAGMAQQRTGTAATGLPAQCLTAIPDTDLKDGASIVRLNAATAKKYGLSQGSSVTLSGAGASCPAKAHISENVMTGVVAVPMGFGHTAFDAFSKGKGDNFLKIMAASAEDGTGMTVWAGSEVKIA